MKKFWLSTPLIPAMAMCAAFSACSGASREQTAGDVEEYCASVDDADDICTNSEPGADSAQPAPAAGQTGFNEIVPKSSEVPPGDLVFF